MRVGDLKRLLADLPDDTPLLRPAGDHGYREAAVSVGTALREGRGQWCEDHGEALTPEAVHGPRATVLIVG